MGILDISLGVLLISHLSAADFSYDGSHGPSHWGEDYHTCIGKYQSPIDIEENDVKSTTFPTLEFHGLTKPHSSFVTNNGHTVMLQANETEAATISGGPNNDTYVFQQLHFHWGDNDRIGSEDLINNHSFSMELHVVFYKKSYGSSAEAMNHPDGLTVLGYLFEAVDDANPTFEPIVAVLPSITEVGAISIISDPMILNKLIMPNLNSMEHYYTYRGSLTTPPCLEIVTWIDFIEPLTLSHDQVAAFRSIHSTDGQNLTHNFRPVQPLDGRVVYRNNPISENSIAGSIETDANNDEKSGQEGIRASLFSPLAALFGTMFLLPYQ